jgi:translation initiation factor 4G
LTERIMHECVKKLVDYEGTPDEAEVESLTSLLRTIGKQLDDPNSKAQGRMDVYFERIKTTIDNPELPSRLRFMLMDIVDLRNHKWVSKNDNKGPKTIGEIRAEAERQAREDELQRLAQQSNRGGRGGPMPIGRGDARSFSYNQLPPPDNSNRVGADDLRRLGNRTTRNPSSNVAPSLGPNSLLGGRTNSGRRGLGPGGLMTRGDESGGSSRTGTPPATKEKDKKDESSTNAFRSETLQPLTHEYLVDISPVHLQALIMRDLPHHHPTLPHPLPRSRSPTLNERDQGHPRVPTSDLNKPELACTTV